MAEANVIQCPNCGQAYFVQPHQWGQYLGQTINCTRCGKPITVTAPVSAQGPAAAVGGDSGQGLGGLGSSMADQAGVEATSFPQGQQGAVPPPTLPAGYPPPQPQFQAGGYPATYQQYGGMYPPPPARTSGWAIASLILGILSFCLPVLGSLAAVGTGIGGIVGTRERRAGGRGLAIAGLALGLFTLVIETPLMVAVMVPAVGKGMQEARKVQCSQNMKELGTALMSYAENHQNQYPAELDDLTKLASPPLPTAYVCPSDGKTPPAAYPPESTAADINSGLHLSYVYVGSGVKSTSDAQTVILYEPLGNHHREGMNVLFADGHVQWVGADEAQSILDQRAKGTRPIKVDGP